MKKKWPLILIIFMSLMMINSDSDCDSQEREDRASVRKQQEHYRISQPVPFYEWSIELDAAIQIYDARVRDRVRTWTVWRSDYGLIEGHCASIGYPIPYDVQLTNPLKPAYNSSGSVVEQAEPSGLYSSHNSIATWVRMVLNVRGKTMVTPVYIESKVTCYAVPITVDYEKNKVTIISDVKPSIVLKDNEAMYRKKKLSAQDSVNLQNQVDKLKKKNSDK